MAGDSPAAVLYTAAGNPVSVLLDDEDGNYRLAIAGKIQLAAPQPPPSATKVTIAADTPIEIAADHDTEYIITDGKTFTIQMIAAGAEGDPTEKGSGAEIHYYDGSTYHLIDRLYLTGETISTYPDTSQARDGTVLTGNGTTKKIVVRRKRYSGVGQEVDVVVRGYEVTTV